MNLPLDLIYIQSDAKTLNDNVDGAIVVDTGNKAKNVKYKTKFFERAKNVLGTTKKKKIVAQESTTKKRIKSWPSESTQHAHH